MLLKCLQLFSAPKISVIQSITSILYNVHSVEAAQGYRVLNIDEGFKQKPMQRSSRLFGEQIPCLASCFASVVLEK